VLWKPLLLVQEPTLAPASKDGYIGDRCFLPCLGYDEWCVNEYPFVPPEQGGYSEDRALDAAILPTKYSCGCRNGFTPRAEFAKEGRGRPLSPLILCIAGTCHSISHKASITNVREAAVGVRALFVRITRINT
jgi:hypothetical protein